MKSIEVKASSVEEAIEKGLAELGMRHDEVDIEIIEVGGLFKKAKVQLTVRPTEGERALEFVRQLLFRMGLKVEAEFAEDDEKAEIRLCGEDSGKIIGRRGDCLDAVQYLASMIANKEGEAYKKIIIDCGDYRQKRVETLEKLARRLADKAVAKGRKIALEPMNPFERRVIHTALSDNPDVTTESEGTEPNRFVVVKPKVQRPQKKRPPQKRGKDNTRKAKPGRSAASKPKGFLGFGEYLGNSRTGAEDSFDRGGTGGVKE
jgi:spoIIIJ-associated protein